jgi:hypothetical protein
MRILENELSSRKAESAFPHADEAEQLGLIPHADGYAPAAPKDLRGTGLDPLVVSHLVLETAYTIPQLSSPPSGQRDVCTCPAQEISEGSPLTTCLESQSRIGSN